MSFKSFSEELLKPIRTYSNALRKYQEGFASLFSIDLISFGYERYSDHGIYLALSSIPEVGEIFLETQAYQNFDDYVIKPIHSNLACDERTNYFKFKYPSVEENSKFYNEFRNRLKHEIGIHISFGLQKIISTNTHNFVWNFAIMYNYNYSLNKIKNIILQDYLKNIHKITKIIQAFENEFYPLIIQKELCKVNILQGVNM